MQGWLLSPCTILALLLVYSDLRTSMANLGITLSMTVVMMCMIVCIAGFSMAGMARVLAFATRERRRFGRKRLPGIALKPVNCVR